MSFNPDGIDEESPMSQDATAVVGGNLLTTDAESLKSMKPEDLLKFTTELIEQIQSLQQSPEATRAARARCLADKLRDVLEAKHNSAEAKWQASRYIVNLIMSETMFENMPSGPRACMRDLVKSEINGGKLPQFRLSVGSRDNLFCIIANANTDNTYGFYMKSDQYLQHAGVFLELDEDTGALMFREDKPSMLGVTFGPEDGEKLLVIEAGDDEAGPVSGPQEKGVCKSEMRTFGGLPGVWRGGSHPKRWQTSPGAAPQCMGRGSGYPIRSIF